MSKIACHNTHAALMACKAMALKPAKDIVIPTQKEFVIDTNTLVLCDAITITIGLAKAVVAVTAN